MCVSYRINCSFSITFWTCFCNRGNRIYQFFWGLPQRHNSALYSGTARYSATTKQQLQMDKPCPAPGRTNPVKGLFGQSSWRSEAPEWDCCWQRETLPFVTLLFLFPLGLKMLQCEKPCVCLVSLEYVMRCDKPQHCLQMQINFPHTSASNKLRRQIVCEQRPVLTFCSSIWTEEDASLFLAKNIFCLWERAKYWWNFCSSNWSERKRWDAAGFLSVFKLIWAGLTHRVNGNLKVLCLTLQ